METSDGTEAGVPNDSGSNGPFEEPSAAASGLEGEPCETCQHGVLIATADDGPDDPHTPLCVCCGRVIDAAATPVQAGAIIALFDEYGFEASDLERQEITAKLEALVKEKDKRV